MSPYDHFYFARPIAADQVNWPIADYRYGGVFFGRNIVHTGVDIPTPEGTPIMAAGPGTVVWTGWGLFSETPGNETDPYGLAVAIRHDFGYNDQQLYTIYAHMSLMNVIMGQHVETGEVIGFVGSTGATTGPHVHFEVRFPHNSFFYTYNPELWIAPPQGWGVLVGRMMDEKGELIQQVKLLSLQKPQEMFL
jgi:murein DD-endopeptidase MepM/ murein hydrolase activator NlpD